MVAQFTAGGAPAVQRFEADAGRSLASPLAWSIVRQDQALYSVGSVKWSCIEARPEMPIAVRMFCAQKGIASEVEGAIGLARGHFKIVGRPDFEAVCDPESGEFYLAIHVNVYGEINEIFQQGRVYSRSLRAAVGRDKADLINVIYHVV